MSSKKIPSSDFAGRLLAWFREHGRHDLPWQKNRSVYRVWVSEIMLQQTQVATVIPYFERFMEKYPDICSLAQAQLDELLALWAGLGYYARARNLHKTAGILVNQYHGNFPQTLQELMDLPGIGRSTAGALLSMGFNRPGTILDANVRRVLARHAGIRIAEGEKEATRKLWDLAESHTPKSRTRDYSQAIMDLGATLCRPSRPDCHACPVRSDCTAFLEARQDEFPGTRARRQKPVRSTRFLMLMDPEGRILLQKRPPAGVWGGLWVFPEARQAENLSADLASLAITADMVKCTAELEGIRHTFTHFHLDIVPCLIQLHKVPPQVQEPGLAWLDANDLAACGSPAPVARLLKKLLSGKISAESDMETTA